MIRVVAHRTSDPRLVEQVLASLPPGARLELVVTDDGPASCARVDATTDDGVRHRVVVVGDRCDDVCSVLDACHARHVVQLPAGAAGLARLLARAA